MLLSLIIIFGGNSEVLQIQIENFLNYRQIFSNILQYVLVL